MEKQSAFFCIVLLLYWFFGLKSVHNRFDMKVTSVLFQDFFFLSETERQSDRDTETETERQTDRQTDRQTQSQRFNALKSECIILYRTSTTR